MKRRRRFPQQVTLVIVGVTLFWALFNLGSIFDAITTVLGMLSPCIIGFMFALILNVPMSAIERTFFKPDKDGNYGKIKAKIKRPVSLLITLVLFFGAIAAVLSVLIPQVIETVGQMYDQVPELVDKVSDHIQNSSLIKKLLPGFEFDSDMIIDKVQATLKDSELLLSTLSSTYNLASSLLSMLLKLIIGLFFAIYMLLQKETLKAQLYRLVTAFVSDKTAERLCYVANMSKTTFSKFISGQSLEALILGSITCIGMLIFGFPYAFTVGVVVALSAFIPILGAIIGSAIGAFLIMFTSIKMALFFVLYMIILMQLESHIVYPYVVGKSVGLPSIWVLFAITVGGAVAGIIGMFISVPVCSVVYCLIKQLVEFKHQDKEAEMEAWKYISTEPEITDPPPDDVTAADIPVPEEA